MKQYFQDHTAQGAKIALVYRSSVICYLRDDLQSIPNPNQWDFPGGVREINETALQCAIRETMEEFQISVSQEMIFHASEYFAPNPTRRVIFFAGNVSKEDIDGISFGSEGQFWKLMNIEEFCNRTDAVPELRIALQEVPKC